MGKLVSSINITPDGFCSHSDVIADEELHQFAIDLLNQADAVLFGRVTYELFESYWPSAAKDMGWIVTFISESNPTSQITIICRDGSNVPHPDVSIEVEDIDQMFEKTIEQHIEIVYSITDELWGYSVFY